MPEYVYIDAASFPDPSQAMWEAMAAIRRRPAALSIIAHPHQARHWNAWAASVAHRRIPVSVITLYQPDPIGEITAITADHPGATVVTRRDFPLAETAYAVTLAAPSPR